jgi:glycosyltransferase involved in cell wall biosynthesis
MNILYISYDGVTDPIGQSQIVPYIRSLSSKGINFTVLTFEKRKNFNTDAEILDSSISWRKLRYHRNPPVISTCSDILQGIIVAIFLLVKGKIKIVHARGYVSAVMALILKWLFGAKFIFDMRGLWAEEKVDAGVWKKEGLLYKITKYFEKMFFVYSDDIIVLTDNAKEVMNKSLYAKYKKDVDVIPTCTDINHFFPIVPLSVRREFGLNAEFIVMYFGSLGTFYGLREMIDFFSVISKYYINNSFFLIITNNLSSSIHRAIQLKNISEKNYKIVHMSYKDLKEILPLASISLMFYKRFLSKAGCCPTKFGESLACGLPVVINSGIGDTEEIIKAERIGVVVEEFSEVAYKKAAEQLMQLLSEQDVLRQRCCAAAEKYFSLTKGTEKYWQVYQRLLKR